MSNEIEHLSDCQKADRIKFANKIEDVCKDFGIKAIVTITEENFLMFSATEIKWENYHTFVIK